MGWDLSQYEPVSDRIERFYKDFSGGRIITEIVARSDKDWVVKASVFRHSKDEEAAATGFAQETIGSSPVNRTSALENCETSAIGRALANLGYDAKGQRASREEMEKVERQNSAGSANPSSASQPRSAAEPQAASREASSPPKHSGEVTDAGSHPPTQAQAVPATSSDQSQKGRLSGEVAGPSGDSTAQTPGGDSQQGSQPASVPPAEESWAVIHGAVGRGTVKPVKVHMAAARLCSDRDGVPIPAKYEDVKDCPPDVLAALAQEVREKEAVSA